MFMTKRKFWVPWRGYPGRWGGGGGGGGGGHHLPETTAASIRGENNVLNVKS